MIDEVRRWLKLAAAVLVSTVFGALAPTTTAVSVVAYSYDAQTVARVEVHAFGAADTSPAQLSVALEESAPPPAAARGTSTTSSHSFVATNTAGGLSDDALRALSTSEQRAVRSLQQQVADHTAKLEAYQANPAAYDNLGILERAPTAEIRQSIIDGRIRHLTNEMKAFQDQIDKLLGGAG